MTMTKFSRINKQREEITMRVLEDMEKGGNEWKKPWVEASPLPPHNPVSGTQYSGRNFLYTYVYGMMRGYADPRWATEKQIKEMGWKVPENLQNGRGGINDELGVERRNTTYRQRGHTEVHQGPRRQRERRLGTLP